MARLAFFRRPSVHILVLCLVSAAVHFAWTQSVYFAAGYDSTGYVAVARWLAGLPPNMWNIYEYYSKGFPAFLDLAGLFWRDDLFIIKLCLAATAVAMPALVYMIVRPARPAWAFVAGLALILSGIPYMFSWELMTDQLHLFLLLVTLALFAQVMRGKSVLWTPLFAVAACLTWFTRPVSLLVVVLFCGILMLYRNHWRRNFRENLAHVAVIVAISAGAFVLASFYHSSLENRPFAPGATQNYGANQMFVAYYFLAPAYFAQEEGTALEPIVVPENGPATRDLFDKLRQTLRASEGWKGTADGIKFGGDPDAFVDDIIRHPRHFYFYQIFWALHGTYNTAAVDPIVADAVKEAVLAHPKLLRYFLFNFIEYVGPRSWYFGDGDRRLYSIRSSLPRPPQGQADFARSIFKNLLGPGALAELSSMPPPPGPIADGVSLFVTFMVNLTERLKPVLVAITLMGFVLSVRSPGYLPPLCAGGILYYSVLPSLILPPQLRYALPIVLFALVGAVVAVPVVAVSLKALSARLRPTKA